MARRSGRYVVGACAAAVVVAVALRSHAGEVEAPERQMLKNVLDAVEMNDHEAFVKDTTPQAKAGFTKQVVQALSGQIAPHMKRGYVLTYLGELRQQGCEMHLWKLVYRDGHDDTLVKLALKNGKIAGLSLQ